MKNTVYNDIVTDNNSNYISININNECPICFNELLATDAILKPECCNNSAHLHCLIEWYTKYSAPPVCFICQQENIFSRNIKNQDNNNECEISVETITLNYPNCFNVKYLTNMFIIICVASIIIICYSLFIYR